MGMLQKYRNKLRSDRRKESVKTRGETVKIKVKVPKGPVGQK
jgi:hypothetical protein